MIINSLCLLGFQRSIARISHKKREEYIPGVPFLWLTSGSFQKIRGRTMNPKYCKNTSKRDPQFVETAVLIRISSSQTLLQEPTRAGARYLIAAYAVRGLHDWALTANCLWEKANALWEKDEEPAETVLYLDEMERKLQQNLCGLL